jgi:uncharacterized OsmC-like protein
VKILLEGENAITLLPAGDPLTIESVAGEQAYSPFHMIGSALATCTFSVLQSWADHAGLQTEDMRLHVAWDFGEDPQRLTNIRMDIEWPSLPDARRLAATRAASHCTVHAILTQPPRIETVVNASHKSGLPSS